MSFITELKRRNVIRMAGLYLVGAWLVTQVAATLLPVFGAPTWVMKALVVLLSIGFFGALMFSWVFELTPQGLKRDAEVPASESIAPQTARRMERVFLVLLTLALGYFAIDKFVLAPKREAAIAARPQQVDASQRRDETRGGIRPIHRRAALRQHELRPGAGVLLRRAVRGTAQPAGADCAAASDRAHFVVLVQGQGARRRQRSPRRSTSPMCSKAACASPATRCASLRSWCALPTARTCGRRPMTANSATCSRCRTRFPAKSSPRSSSSCCPTSASPAPSAPATLAAYEQYLIAKKENANQVSRAQRAGSVDGGHPACDRARPGLRQCLGAVSRTDRRPWPISPKARPSARQ
jgi:hypothetical protein